MKFLKASIFLLLAIGLAAGCKRRCECVPPPYQSYYFKGRVLNSSVSACNLPLVDFSEDSARIRQLTGIDNPYGIVKGLQPSLNEVNKKLYLMVRTPDTGEDFSCPMSVDFPHLLASDAHPRD